MTVTTLDRHWTASVVGTTPWLAGLLLVATAFWTATMAVSLGNRSLDRMVVGASHGRVGYDFFAIPRAYRNLLAGESVFLTEVDSYGPHATWYLHHPMIAIAVGAWTAPLEPWTACALFVCLSVVLLVTAAWAIASRCDGPALKAFALFAMLCSLPTYLMLWNGQMHVLLVLSVALILAGLMGLERSYSRDLPMGRVFQPVHSGDRISCRFDACSGRVGKPVLQDELLSGWVGKPFQQDKWALRWIQIGLIISLLSKPIVVLMLPVLLAVKETRRAVLLPVAIYAAVSLVFLFVPALNPGGYNGIHWLNVMTAASSHTPSYWLLLPIEFPLPKNPEIYSLPTLVYRLTGGAISPLLLKAPLAVIAAVSLLPLLLSGRSQRIRVAIVAVAMCVLSHFLSYYMVWEYHYTQILPVIPVLLWMAEREPVGWRRGLLLAAFVVSLAVYLPTPYFLAPDDPWRYATASTLLRVVPVLIAFVCLAAYAFGLAWPHVGRVFQPVHEKGHILDGRVGKPVLQVRLSCIWASTWRVVPGRARLMLPAAAAVGIMGLAVLAGVYGSTPRRMTVMPAAWTDRDWLAHIDAMVARPRTADTDDAAKHIAAARACGAMDLHRGLDHYFAAMKLRPMDNDLAVEMAGLLAMHRQYRPAAAVCARVLQSEPDNAAAQRYVRGAGTSRSHAPRGNALPGRFAASKDAERPEKPGPTRSVGTRDKE